MSAKDTEKTIIVFSCNWQAYSSLEQAGINQRAYPPTVYPLRLACLGRITPGIILKAFEKGADGVYLIGCPEDECRHHTGSLTARKIYQETKGIMRLMGLKDTQLVFANLEADDGNGFLKGLEILMGAE
jgi:coenzyme F420-reducing hydrogenase delta subunit